MCWFMDIGERLRLLRERAGLSQEVAGKRLNKDQTWLSRRELGVTACKPDDVQEIAALYGYDVHTVFMPEGTQASELLQAVSELDPEQSIVLAEVARALPSLAPGVRDLILAQMSMIAAQRRESQD